MREIRYFRAPALVAVDPGELFGGERTQMPAALTYPGVYIEELPSGVRTITGVAIRPIVSTASIPPRCPLRIEANSGSGQSSE
jgi:hypothetical protein